ncbi:MAG: hypothetical protein K5799_03980 [Erythrobacter sp.]|nr:hypothetical protein [Erythrobacter sp.]
MLTIPAAAARLRREVNDAETKVADALIATTALLHTSALARSAAVDLHPMGGHAELRRLTKSVDGLVTLRAELIRVHSGYEKTGREMGILDEPKPYIAGAIPEELEERAA